MQIYTKGEGLVEFNSQDEMEHVIRKLDNTKFDGEYIRLIVSVSRMSLVLVTGILVFRIDGFSMCSCSVRGTACLAAIYLCCRLWELILHALVSKGTYR